MAENIKIPELRFKKFDDEWEEKKLGEESEIIAGGTPSTVIKKYWMPKEIPWMSSGEINKKRLYETDNMISKEGLYNSSAKWVKKESVLIALAGQGKTRGTVAINNIPLTTNQSIAAIIPKPNINYEFLYQNLGKRYEELRTKSSGDGSRGGLNKQLISEIEIICPDIKEQAKIGIYFQNIDKLITLHQQKYDKLEIIKKALLEKMFPKKGVDIPEIRFKGFDEAWEKRKLLENIEKIIDFRGRTPKKLGLDWSETGYLALSALNVKNGYIDPDIDAHYGNQELYDKWMLGNELHENQVLFTTEAPMGNVAQVPDNKKYILSQRTIAFKVNPNLITEDFLAVVLGSPQMVIQLSSLLSGGTAKGVSQKSLTFVDVLIPKNINEQNMVGEYFKKLNNLISIHQKELDKLKNFKIACLDKMLV